MTVNLLFLIKRIVATNIYELNKLKLIHITEWKNRKVRCNLGCLLEYTNAYI